MGLGTCYLGLFWLTFYLQELQNKIVRKAKFVIISSFVSYFEIIIIQKKHEEANHDLFNASISSLFFSVVYQARWNKESHKAQSMGDKIQPGLGLSLLPQGLFYLPEGHGPPPSFRGLTGSQWQWEGNVPCVILICAYEKHVKAVNPFCSRDWLWLSGFLSFRTSLEGTLCLIGDREKSQNGKDDTCALGCCHVVSKGELECLRDDIFANSPNFIHD